MSRKAKKTMREAVRKILVARSVLKPTRMMDLRFCPMRERWCATFDFGEGHMFGKYRLFKIEVDTDYVNGDFVSSVAWYTMELPTPFRSKKVFAMHLVPAMQKSERNLSGHERIEIETETDELCRKLVENKVFHLFPSKW